MIQAGGIRKYGLKHSKMTPSSNNAIQIREKGAMC